MKLRLFCRLVAFETAFEELLSGADACALHLEEVLTADI
jgi:hypothetical protein